MKKNEHNFDNDSDFPFDKNGKNPFELPSDYFSSFEDKIKKRLETENELAEFTLLSGISKINTFSVPDSYFLNSEVKLEECAELSGYAILSSIKKPAFEVLNEDYINSLKVSLQYKIDLAEELKSCKTLYQIDKVKVFDVPEYYFDDLPLRIKNSVYTVRNTHVSLLDKVLDFIFGRKLSLSLGFLVILAFSLLIYRVSKENVEPGNCQTIACLEKQEILNGQLVNSFDEEQLMELVDVKSLDKQLQIEILNTDSLSEEEFILDNVDTDLLLEEL